MGAEDLGEGVREAGDWEEEVREEGDLGEEGLYTDTIDGTCLTW